MNVSANITGKINYYDTQDGNDKHFYDYNYNGTKITRNGTTYLNNGIGKLADGILGSSKPSSILSNEWLGWSSATVSTPVLIFAFATEQAFYQVYIHCLTSYPFTLFRSANISFSNDSSSWTMPVTYYVNKSSTIASDAFFITFKLHNQTGRFIKLNLTYDKANTWMALSEVWFMAATVNGKYNFINKNGFQNSQNFQLILRSLYKFRLSRLADKYYELLLGYDRLSVVHRILF